MIISADAISYQLMNSLPGPMQAGLAVLVLTAAIYDMRYRRIPNWLILIGLLAGFSMATVFSRTDGLKTALLGAALAFAIYLPLFALRAMGAGDLKLMVAIGAFTGPFNWIVVFMITSILGGVLALALLLYRGQLGRTLGNVIFILRELLHLRAPYRARPDLDVAHPGAVRLPHGVAIAGGTLLFLAFNHF
jgi:prepilin peptidase CpaA